MLYFSEITRIALGFLPDDKNEQDFLCTISTDTRNLQEGQVFLALSGGNFDGHHFLNDAVCKGAKGLIISQDLDADHYPVPVIKVSDTLKTYLAIAKYYKNKINPKVVAVTGSSGKTTTKELIYHILSSSYKTHKSFANHNNEIGLCETLLSMPEDTEIVVIEMGMRGLNEIRLLAQTVLPDVSVITNIGTAHLGRLEKIENIAIAKCELLEEMQPDGLAIVYNQSDLCQRVKDIWQGKTIIYGDDFELAEDFFIHQNKKFYTHFSGKHNINNTIAAIHVAEYFHIQENMLFGKIKSFEIPEGRGNMIKLHSDIILIDDTYNANPESMKNALIALYDKFSSYKIGIVIGDMQELGSEAENLHKDIAAYIDVNHTEILVTIGQISKVLLEDIKTSAIQLKHYEKVEDSYQYLKDQLSNKKINLLFLKGSRAAKLDRIVKLLCLEMNHIC